MTCRGLTPFVLVAVSALAACQTTPTDSTEPSEAPAEAETESPAPVPEPAETDTADLVSGPFAPGDDQAEPASKSQQVVAIRETIPPKLRPDAAERAPMEADRAPASETADAAPAPVESPPDVPLAAVSRTNICFVPLDYTNSVANAAELRVTIGPSDQTVVKGGDRTVVRVHEGAHIVTIRFATRTGRGARQWRAYRFPIELDTARLIGLRLTWLADQRRNDLRIEVVEDESTILDTYTVRSL